MDAMRSTNTALSKTIFGFGFTLLAARNLPELEAPSCWTFVQEGWPWERSEPLVLEPTGKERTPPASVPMRDVMAIDHAVSIRRQKQAERESAWLK